MRGGGDAVQTGPVDRESANGAYSGAESKRTCLRKPSGGRAHAAGFRAARVEPPPRRFKLIGDSHERGGEGRGLACAGMVRGRAGRGGVSRQMHRGWEDRWG